MSAGQLHCWFNFEDGYWLDDDTRVPGHTCMLEDNHDGPHESTSDDDIGIEFNGSEVAEAMRQAAL